MEFVIIDSRNGGARLLPEAAEAIDKADVVLHIEQDDVVRCEFGTHREGDFIPNAQLFYAQTEAEQSAAKAAEDLDNRVGKSCSEHDNEEAMRKATAVWDRMRYDEENPGDEDTE